MANLKANTWVMGLKTYLLWGHSQGRRAPLSAGLGRNPYTQVAVATPYDRKASVAAAGLLNDRVAPLFDTTQSSACGC